MSASKAARTALALTALAATTFAVSATAGSNTAEAKKLIIKVGHVHHLHHRHFIGPRLIVPLVAASYVGGCYWMKERAQALDSRYWWNRYAACRGF